MIIRIFRGTGAGPAFLIILFGFALWAEYIFFPPAVANTLSGTGMPLWDIITRALRDSPGLAVVVSMSILLVLLIIIARFNTSLFFIPRRTYFPVLFYIFFFSLFPGEMILNPVLPAAVLILAGVWRMMTAYRLNGLAFCFFDSALLISLAGIFYANAIWFVALVFLGLFILRSPDMREIAVAIVGILLPWILFYAVWYLVGRDVSDLTAIITGNLFDEVASVYWSRTLVILLMVAALLILPALFYLIREMPTKKIKSRKTFALLLWMLVISVAIYLFVPGVSVEIIAIAGIPVAYLISNYAAFTRRVNLYETFLWMMIIMLAVSRIWPY